MRNPSSKNDAARPAAAAKATSKTTPCCSKVGLKRGPWTPEEDEIISTYIKKEGEGRWRTLPKRAGLLRCGKSCRLRWMNYLRPTVKRGQIAPDEEDLILRLHRLLGNSKKLIGQGIDPRTHKPLHPDQIFSNSANPAAPKTASSSEPKNNTDDGFHGHNSDPSPVFSTGEEASCGSQVVATATDKEIGPSENHIGHNPDYAPDSNYLDTIGMRSGRHGLSNDDEDLNFFGGDDMFSFFLNSVITEEAFPDHHSDATVASLDPLIAFATSSSTLGIGNGWESALMASTTALDEKIKMAK